MNGGHGISSALVPAGYDLRLRGLSRAAAISTSGLLLLVGLVLMARRLAGALVEPLAGAAPLGVAIMLVALALLVRRALGSPRRWTAIDAMPTAWLLLVGGALSLPGTWWPALAGFWTLIAAEEAWSWYGVRHWPVRSNRPGRDRWPTWVRLRTAPALPVPVVREPLADEESLRNIEVGFTADADKEVTQQLTRSQAADGSETLRGWLRARFAPGQRTAYLHLAFCPPFARQPRLEYQQADGPAARIKVGQLLPYGVRLELKLSEPGPADVLVELSAVGQPLAPAVPTAEAAS